MPIREIELEARKSAGLRLRALRIAHGYSNAARFAALVSLHRVHLLMMENGERPMDISLIGRICTETGATADWLLRGIAKGMDRDLLDRIAGRKPPLFVAA